MEYTLTPCPIFRDQLIDLAWLVGDGAMPAGPIAQGVIVREAWLTGKYGSILVATGYSRRKIIGWFKKAHPLGLMNVAERKVLAELPERVVAFRGCRPDAINGLSWSLEQAVAERFAEMWQGAVYRREISKRSILAYINDRNERELVVDCNRLNSSSRRKITLVR